MPSCQAAQILSIQASKLSSLWDTSSLVCICILGVGHGKNFNKFNQCHKINQNSIVRSTNISRQLKIWRKNLPKPSKSSGKRRESNFGNHWTLFKPGMTFQTSMISSKRFKRTLKNFVNSIMRKRTKSYEGKSRVESANLWVTRFQLCQISLLQQRMRSQYMHEFQTWLSIEFEFEFSSFRSKISSSIEFDYK